MNNHERQLLLDWLFSEPTTPLRQSVQALARLLLDCHEAKAAARRIAGHYREEWPYWVTEYPWLIEDDE
jgi:hypothetical protein